MTKNKQQQQQKEPSKVTCYFSTSSLIGMILHANQHRTVSVHGILIGSYDDDGKDAAKVNVTGILPVCHEVPTKPLIQTALGLAQSMLEEDNKDRQVIVGWYTAPELLSQDKPGPVAQRLVANMDMGGDDDKTKSKNDPILVSIVNDKVGDLINGLEVSPSDALRAFGRNFSDQWMEPLEVELLGGAGNLDGIKNMYNGGMIDLVDHWQSKTLSEWKPVTSTTA